LIINKIPFDIYSNKHTKKVAGLNFEVQSSWMLQSFQLKLH